MSKIEDNKYYKKLDFFKENEKLSLTRNNADFIEAVLMIDSRYKDSNSRINKPSVEYVEYLKEESDKKIKLHRYGSSSYWIKQFIEIAKIIKDKKNNSEKILDTLTYEKKKENENQEINIKLDLKTIINGVVYAIDRENSTHLSAHQSGNTEGRRNVSQKIYDYIIDKQNGIEKFVKQLIKKNEFSLIGYITVPKNDDENFHYSFATKFCKYVSNAFTSDIEAKKIFKFDKSKDEDDKYYIYDNIIISNIGYYINEYLNGQKIEVKKLKFDKKKYTNEKEIIEQYRKFYNCLEDIRNNTAEKITRNEMDHIIWYSNK